MSVYVVDTSDYHSESKQTTVVQTCGARTQKGDLNKDLRVDIADAVIALKILSGQTADRLRTDFATCGADVNNISAPDVGLEEAVYALQKAAGLRE